MLLMAVDCLILGYMLLAGKCRKPEEATVIQETIEKIMKRKIDNESVFTTGSLTTSNILKQVNQQLWSIQFTFEFIIIW